MKVNELRIGNHVQLKEKLKDLNNIIEVSSLTGEELSY